VTLPFASAQGRRVVVEFKNKKHGGALDRRTRFAQFSIGAA
jgi:hypothetical protein